MNKFAKRISKLKIETKILLLILLLAFGLRFWGLHLNPLYGDELTMVYDSYSVFRTGHDQTGQLLPITFSMGAGRPAGYVYFSIPFVALFGPSEYGVRLLSLISGVGLVVLAYLLGRRLISEKTGLFAAFLMAINPWSISLSSAGFESNFALFLSTLAVYLFLQIKKSPRYLIFSALCFALAIHTYPTFKLTIPLMIVTLFWFTKPIKYLLQKQLRKSFFISVAILLFAGFIAIAQTLTAGSESRFADINVFSQEKLQQEIIQKINNERTDNSLPGKITQIFHNKTVEYSSKIFESYLDNLSPSYLFLHGDKNPRHNMATMGEFLVVEILFMLTGLYYLFSRVKRVGIFLVAWILIAAIPASLLLEPHALRNSYMLAPLNLISGVGLLFLWELTRKAKKNSDYLKGVIVIVIFANFAFFVNRFYYLAPYQLGHYWSESARIAAQRAIYEQNNYDYVFLSDRIDNVEYAYPVYAKVNPQEVISQNANKTKLNGREFKKLGSNVYVGQIAEGDVENFLSSLPGKTLLIDNYSQNLPYGDYETINGCSNKPSVIIKRSK